VAKTACGSVLPITHGAFTLSEPKIARITSVAAYRGQTEALSEALRAAHGMRFPEPGRATGKAGARCIWSGRGQAFLMGPEPDAGLATLAALTDQSDAWAVVDLEGPGCDAVLARLVPVDLRPSVFKRGHTARTLCGHMSVSITRLSDTRFQVMAFRSMARTLAHELDVAMGLVAARQQAG
jgi:sarcosine oxidase subunit gamma